MEQTSVWTSVVTGWERALAFLDAGPLEVAFLGLALGGLFLLAACAFRLRSLRKELIAIRGEVSRALVALRELEDPATSAAADLVCIRERLDKALPPKIHVDAIVANALEIRAGTNGEDKRPNPNLIVHDFD